MDAVAAGWGPRLLLSTGVLASVPAPASVSETMTRKSQAINCAQTPRYA